MSARNSQSGAAAAHEDDHPEEDAAMLDPNEAGEVIPDDEDAPMDSDDDDGDGADADSQDIGYNEIALQNDSIAHFDAHNDSIFCIAQHPVHPQIIATGGGDDVGYVFDATPAATSANETDRKSVV